jgi:hypothetical protein
MLPNYWVCNYKILYIITELKKYTNCVPTLYTPTVIHKRTIIGKKKKNSTHDNS